jgi:hypothetical protein
MLDQLTPWAAIAAMAVQQAGPISVDQLSSGVPIVHVSVDPPTGEAPAQISSKRQSRSTSQQLVSGPPSAASGQQLSNAKPSAQPPAPLSSRSDGRPNPTERLAGNDRCDPQDGTESRDAKCAQIIEKRASAFKGSEAPQLSPEEKILLEQSELERKSYEAAARRLATSGDDSDSLETQGVAFVVLRPPAREEQEKPEDKPTEVEAAAAGLVEAILNPAPQQ